MSLLLPNTHTSGQRDRLITRYLHWINRMSSEQGGQQHAFLSPSRVTPQSFGDCRGQRGTSQLPCIFSSSNSTSILRQACRNYQCSHCSKVKTHLIATILFIVVVALAALSFARRGSFASLAQLVSHLFLAHDVMLVCLVAIFFMSFCSLIPLLHHFLCVRSLPQGF